MSTSNGTGEVKRGSKPEGSAKGSKRALGSNVSGDYAGKGSIGSVKKSLAAETPTEMSMVSVKKSLTGETPTRTSIGTEKTSSPRGTLVKSRIGSERTSLPRGTLGKTSMGSQRTSLPRGTLGKTSMGSERTSLPRGTLDKTSIGSERTSLPRGTVDKTSTGSERTSLPQGTLGKTSIGSVKTVSPRGTLGKTSIGSAKTVSARGTLGKTNIGLERSSFPREENLRTSTESAKSILRPGSKEKFSFSSDKSSTSGAPILKKLHSSNSHSPPRESAAMTSLSVKPSREEGVGRSGGSGGRGSHESRGSERFSIEEGDWGSPTGRGQDGSGGTFQGSYRGTAGGQGRLSKTGKGSQGAESYGGQEDLYGDYQYESNDGIKIYNPEMDEIQDEYGELAEYRGSDEKYEQDDEDDDDEDAADNCPQEGMLELNTKLNDFVRAKEYFMTKSAVSGISLYDHLSELIRKLLDNRAPDNPVDFIEELSLNLKRYRFEMPKDLIQDSYFLSPHVVKEANNIVRHWKKNAMWSKERRLASEDSPTFGGFPNLLRLQYYLEQINAGLPREEMFSTALMLREIQVRYPSMPRVRFWGKIFAIKNNYYVFESELESNQALRDVFYGPPPSPPDRQGMEENDPYFTIPGAGATFQRAGNAVTDPEILQLYQISKAEGSLVPPNSAGGDESLGERLPVFQDSSEVEDLSKWQEFQMELMTGFPVPKFEEGREAPPEEVGQGVNRRQFFVVVEPVSGRTTPDSVIMPNAWENLRVFEEGGTGLKIVPLGSVTPQQINVSRMIRWHLTGELAAKVISVPPFPGCEADYLRALLARITAGTAVSPKGYFSGKKREKEGDEELGEEEEDLDDEEDEEEQAGVGDIVYPKEKFRPADIAALTTTPLGQWVHHASHILKQGRTKWFDVNPAKKPPDEELGEDEELGDEEEEEEGAAVPANKEYGPELFSPLSDDKARDDSNPWAVRASSSIFKEFQVAYVRSNIWPGAHALCTSKGKVENIYFGDGLKFNPRSYAPFIPDEPQKEYKEGPEIMEIDDPTVEAEQEWLAKLQLSEIADIEPKFVDNEVEGEDEEEDTEGEDTGDDD